MDHIRRILNKCNISTAELEQLSTDRDTWKSACASGLATYNVVSDQAAEEDRRTRRYNPPNPLTTGPRCPQCSQICASEFGLRSHLRRLGVMSHVSHVHISNTPSSTNVIVELDGLLQASKHLLLFQVLNFAHSANDNDNNNDKNMCQTYK